MINPYIFNIKGALSRADAVVLNLVASKSRCVFEFGVGGSTMILGSSIQGKLFSFETNNNWINKTKANLELCKSDLMTTPKILKSNYEDEVITKMYKEEMPDLIFIDCLGSERPRVFKTLFEIAAPGTKFMLHDCRAAQARGIASEVLLRVENDVRSIESSYLDSNMVIIEKSYPRLQVNWSVTEAADTNRSKAK